MTRTTVGAFPRRQLATSALTPLPRSTIESQRGGLVSDGDLQSRRRDRQTVSRSRPAGLASLDSHANPLRDAIRAAALSPASHGAHGPARLALHLLHDDALRTRGQPVVVPGLSHPGPRRADSGSGARCPGEPGVNAWTLAAIDAWRSSARTAPTADRARRPGAAAVDTGHQRIVSDEVDRPTVGRVLDLVTAVGVRDGGVEQWGELGHALLGVARRRPLVAPARGDRAAEPPVADDRRSGGGAAIQLHRTGQGLQSDLALARNP
jgi:hypothetical protein